MNNIQEFMNANVHKCMYSGLLLGMIFSSTYYNLYCFLTSIKAGAF